jgi:hypothetical protein
MLKVVIVIMAAHATFHHQEGKQGVERDALVTIISGKGKGEGHLRYLQALTGTCLILSSSTSM